MNKKIVSLFLSLIISSSICGVDLVTVTNTFVAKQVASATQVNTNFSDLKNGVTDGTKKIKIGEIENAGQLKNQDGTVALPGYTFTSDLDSGLYRIGTDNIGISLGGINYVDLSATALITSGNINVTTGNIVQYHTVNDANPQWRLGAVDAEELHIQSVFDSGAQTLDYVLFQTDVASGTTDKGEFRFNVDGTEIGQINDGGFNLVTGLAYDINDVVVLNETTLGTNVVNSSLTNLGTLTGFTLNSATATLSQDTDVTISGGVNGLSVDGTTFSVDGANNRVGIGDASPGERLSVGDAANAAEVMASFSSGGYSLFIENDASNSSIYTTSATRGMAFGINSVDKIFIDTSGQLGVGQATPSTRLHIGDSGNSVEVMATFSSGGYSFAIENNSTNTRLYHDSAIRDLVFGTNSLDWVSIGTTGLLTVTRSIVVGSPTGGDQGAGTINAVGVYDDGALLTDYVFEKHYLGETIEKKYADFKMKSFDEEIKYTKKNLHLSTIDGRKEWEVKGRPSIGKLAQQIWETLEIHFLYSAEQKQRIDKLEKEIKKLKQKVNNGSNA